MFKLISAVMVCLGLNTAVAQSAMPKLSDKEIAKVLKTIDEGEIEAGKYAEKMAQNTHVKSYAKEMVKAHEEHSAALNNLAKKNKMEMADSGMTKMLKESSKTAMNDLKNQAKGSVDMVYLDQQINMHNHALDTIKNTLMPSVQNPELKAMLQKTEGVVAGHLEEAKKLKTML